MKVKHQPTPEKIAKVKKFIPEFTKLCEFYIRPLYFGELPLISLEPILNNGTATFINTGIRSFGITNYHVYKTYLERKSKLKYFSCQIGSLKVDLESRILDANSDGAIDLLTFELTEQEINILKLSPLFHNKWPIQYSKEEVEPVFILGFPGHMREIESESHIIAKFGTFMVNIESISEKRLVIVFDRENWISSLNSKNIDLTNLGGFSGAGVFRMNNLVPELLGIVSDHDPNSDIMLCTRSDFISKNGGIRKI